MAGYGYFAGLFGSGSQTSIGMSSLYSNLGQYNTIQKGVYKKLLTAYFRTASDDDTKDDKKNSIKSMVSSADKSAYSKTTKYASALSLASQELLVSRDGDLYDEGNEEELVSKVKTFVSSYNTVLADAKKSDSTTVRNLATGMENTAASYAKKLETIGITVNSDNTLSVDTDKLKNADKLTVKNVLGSHSSFTGSTMKLASQIGSTATAAVNGFSTYSSYGTYASPSIGSYYDLYS